MVYVYIYIQYKHEHIQNNMHTYENVIYIYYLRAAAPAADPGSKYGGLATFGYLLKQGNLGTNLRNISK